MRILVFLHGTTIMQSAGAGKTREVRVRQSAERDPSVLAYESYIPIDHAAEKLTSWEQQGAEIMYLSSHESEADMEKDRVVLRRFHFPDGPIRYRERWQSYRDIVEEVIPDVVIEDDCESIGGAKEMATTFLEPHIQQRVRSVVIKEFQGIDHLPDRIDALRSMQ
ncbi:hypothetical protein HYV74_02650 [Candidatus Uhrbacteria bacterium]|nr:hypothetical protein [Candidatus Uhrbacteria bacterium]